MRPQFLHDASPPWGILLLPCHLQPPLPLPSSSLSGWAPNQCQTFLRNKASLRETQCSTMNLNRIDRKRTAPRRNAQQSTVRQGASSLAACEIPAAAGQAWLPKRRLQLQLRHEQQQKQVQQHYQQHRHMRFFDVWPTQSFLHHQDKTLRWEKERDHFRRERGDGHWPFYRADARPRPPTGMCCSPAGITHCENRKGQKGTGFPFHFCFRTHSLSVRRRSKEEGKVRCLAAPVRQRSGGGGHRESRESKGKQVTPPTPIHRLRAPPLAPPPTME